MDAAIIRLSDIERSIYLFRGRRVMLGQHLAALYGVSPKALVQAVKRNRDRFPADFLFQLAPREFAEVRSELGADRRGGLRRATPYAFTQEGVAMLSGVLRSPRAVRVNIAIMRTFVRLREMLASNRSLREKLEELEQRVERHDERITSLFEAMESMGSSEVPPSRQIGFRP